MIIKHDFDAKGVRNINVDDMQKGKSVERLRRGARADSWGTGRPGLTQRRKVCERQIRRGPSQTPTGETSVGFGLLVWSP